MYACQLNCYAPGNGSLEFVWLEEENGQRVASGIFVTKKHVLEWLLQEENQHFVTNGWIIKETPPYRPEYPPHIILIHKVVRVNRDTLKMSGELYNYTIQPSLFWRRDGHVQEHCLDVTRYMPELGITEVKNLSTKMALCYFLNHEESQPWTPPENL